VSTATRSRTRAASSWSTAAGPAAALAQVATGRAEAYWGPGLQPWDGAAGLLLVAEAGGTVGDLGFPTPGAVPPTGDVLAAPAALWEPLRALLLPAYGGS
jgi:myo-inositol-1(or 4)-monophosphatase